MKCEGSRGGERKRETEIDLRQKERKDRLLRNKKRENKI